jgi:hypothetical protein
LLGLQQTQRESISVGIPAISKLSIMSGLLLYDFGEPKAWLDATLQLRSLPEVSIHILARMHIYPANQYWKKRYNLWEITNFPRPPHAMNLARELAETTGNVYTIENLSLTCFSRSLRQYQRCFRSKSALVCHARRR